MASKKIVVWLSSTLTFIAFIHLIEAASVFLFDAQVMILRVYPLIGGVVDSVQPAAYFWLSVILTLTLWGITCATIFENPVETFLNNMLSEAKQQSEVETELTDEKSEILDAMNETVETNSMLLAQVKDVLYNIRTEVKEIQPLKENLDKLKAELWLLENKNKRVEEDVKETRLCPTCGKTILQEFKVCPYCSENLSLFEGPVIQ